MRSKTRLAVATVAIALLTGGSVAAAEASTATPSSTSPTVTCKTPAPGGSANPGPGGKKPMVPPGTPDPQESAALARILGVSRARATAVLERLDVLSRGTAHGVEVTDPGFRSLAASLGLTPTQFNADLMHMKESLSAVPAPSGSAKS
ncbi:MULTISPECIES: hypothetical protein [Streptacidiphilus]|uniref:Uncharacterized protein n=1 Tax=Streptacidiphilus cavernicola TaxID=3342716 RepID=A0ABV6UIU3_9ACTN|nr:hypothetical protein [Streptacidiphilus jeojiense]